MSKKISGFGNAITRAEQKRMKGGIGPCGPRTYRVCTYQFTSSAACCNWAVNVQYADDFTWDAATCKCCALTYTDGGDCGPAIP